MKQKMMTIRVEIWILFDIINLFLLYARCLYMNNKNCCLFIRERVTIFILKKLV